MNEEEEQALLGVVQPLPGMENPTTYERAVLATEAALVYTTQRLADLRKHRDETEVEIKRLVQQKDLLERMVRVDKRKEQS